MSNTQSNQSQKHAELAALQAVAKQLHAAQHPKRSRKARKAGLAKVSAARPKSQHRFSWVLFSVPAAGFAALVLVVIVASSALPGQKLYAIKRVTEAAQDTASITLNQKINNCSTFMQRRAEELAYITTHNASAEKVNAIAQDLLYEANEYEEFVSQSGDKQEAYKSQEIRDIKRAIDTLNSVDTGSSSQEVKELIESTVDKLEQLT